MKIGLAIIALYGVAVIVLTTRFDGKKKKDRSRLSGRGGDFES